MKKLLHERLREYGSKCHADHTEWLKQRHANELADEIEKYYIPRPRFEDGEPVQRTDKVDWENLRDYHPQSPWMITAIRNDGRPIATAGDKVVAVANITDDGFVKRPEPKALDADGVEIKVGDTVYDTSNGKALKVTEVLKSSVGVIGELGCGSILAEHITHREPDSLEKLRDDMAEYKTDTHFAELKTEHTFGEFIDRLTAIMERGA